MAHGYFAHFDLEITRAHYVAADTNNPGAGIAGTTEVGIFRPSHGDDVLHMAQRLDVVDDGRTHVKTEHGREIGRFDPGIGTFTFKRFDQPGFLATNIGPGPAMNVDLYVELGAENIFAEEVVCPGFLNGALEDFRPFRELAPYIYIGGMGVESITGNQDTFE